MVGFYLVPYFTYTLGCIVAAIGRKPQGTELLVPGYFNADLLYPDGHVRNATISTAIATEGMEDMVAHFLPCYLL